MTEWAIVALELCIPKPKQAVKKVNQENMFDLGRSTI